MHKEMNRDGKSGLLLSDDGTRVVATFRKLRGKWVASIACSDTEIVGRDLESVISIVNHIDAGVR